MELVKNYQILEVRGRRWAGEALYLLAEPVVPDPSRWQGPKSKLILDQETCARSGIVPALDLVGKTLQCTFAPRVLPQEPSYGNEKAIFSDRSRLAPHEMGILALRREETCDAWQQTYNVGLESPEDFDQNFRKFRVSYFLRLSTFEDGVGTVSISRCPRYHFVVDLTEEEYRTYAQSEAGTVVGVKLTVL